MKAKKLLILNDRFDIVEIETGCAILWNNDDGEEHKYNQGGPFIGSLVRFHEMHGDDTGEGMWLKIVLGPKGKETLTPTQEELDGIMEELKKWSDHPIAIRVRKHIFLEGEPTIKSENFFEMNDYLAKMMKNLKKNEELQLTLGYGWGITTEDWGWREEKYPAIQFSY